MTKIAKFYELMHDKPKIGMPAKKLGPNDTFSNEIIMIEKWPLCQAYGLDLVGNGFFTMKHQVVNLRDDLDIVYAEYDSFAYKRLVFDEIEKFGHHYYDNFN